VTNPEILYSVSCDSVCRGKTSMNHGPRRAIKLGNHILADEAPLSKAVYKFRSTELSIQDSLDLAVDCLGDIDFCGCFSYSHLISLTRNNRSGNLPGFCNRQAVSIVKRAKLLIIFSRCPGFCGLWSFQSSGFPSTHSYVMKGKPMGSSVDMLQPTTRGTRGMRLCVKASQCCSSLDNMRSRNLDFREC